MNNLEQLMVKTAEVLDSKATEQEKLATITKMGSEAGLDASGNEYMRKFASDIFRLSKLDAESLVKKALGLLGDKPNEVDSFLAGIDAFIAEAKMDKAAACQVKVAAALDVLAQNEMTPENAALWHQLFGKIN